MHFHLISSKEQIICDHSTLVITNSKVHTIQICIICFMLQIISYGLLDYFTHKLIKYVCLTSTTSQTPIVLGTNHIPLSVKCLFTTNYAGQAHFHINPYPGMYNDTHPYTHAQFNLPSLQSHKELFCIPTKCMHVQQMLNCIASEHQSTEKDFTEADNELFNHPMLDTTLKVYQTC